MSNTTIKVSCPECGNYIRQVTIGINTNILHCTRCQATVTVDKYGIITVKKKK